MDIEETENGKLRVSESRSKVYFDYAERKQIQDDEPKVDVSQVGLKRERGKRKTPLHFVLRMMRR